MPPVSQAKISNVEAGRGIAATLVVLYHTSKYYFSTPKYWSGSALHGLFAFGHAGVEFFFVLSGYIMWSVHWKDIGNPSRAVYFARKRFLRIYPFFWLILFFTIAASFAIPTLGQPHYRDPSVIIQSALLIGQEPLQAIVFVSWTMWYEIIFYAIFALAIFSPKIGIPIFFIWILASILLGLTGLATPWPYYMTGFINLLFFFGIASALFLQRWEVRWPKLILCIGTVLFLGTGLFTDYADPVPEWLTHLLFGIGATFMLVGGVSAERSDFVAPKWMVALGSASFSIYLTHMLTLTAIAKLALGLHLPGRVSAPVAFCGLALTAILVGVAIHYLIERRVLKAAALVWPTQAARDLAAKT